MDANCFFETRDSFAEAPQTQQRGSKIVMGRSVAGVERKGATAGLLGFVEAAQRSQRFAPVAVHVGGVGIQADGAVEVDERRGAIAQLVKRNAEQVVGLRVPRFRGG